MIRVGVIGATGYAGAELVRILAGHPEVFLTVLTSRQYAGVSFEKVYPAMSGMIDLECEGFDEARVCEKADVIFMALPHKLPMGIVPGLLKQGKKVIDLSADFRFSDLTVYESFYQTHTARDLCERAVYGLCEVFTERIKGSDLIANPGCYPTSVLLPLFPLVTNGLIDPNTIIADAKSGVSGAGRSLALTTHFCEADESFKAYKVGAHRHKPEMDEKLSIAAGKPVNIIFVPHLLPMTRGMETTIYADLAASVKDRDIYDCIYDFYAGRRFIRLTDHRPPDTLHVRGTNLCDIGYVVEEDKGRLILMSVIDNLVKGAAGQAVQNMNIMLGRDEASGLELIPYPV